MAEAHGLQVAEYGHSARIQAIDALIRQHGPEIWDRALDEIRETPFLRGSGSRGWRVTLDWLIAEDHCVAVAEGRYRPWTADRADGAKDPAQPRTIGQQDLDWMAQGVTHPQILRQTWHTLHRVLGREPTQVELEATYREAERATTAGEEVDVDDDAIHARAWWVGTPHDTRRALSVRLGYTRGSDRPDLSDDSTLAARAWRKMQHLQEAS